MTKAPASPPPRLLAFLPQVKGRYQPEVPLEKHTWFRVGGPAEILFKPADAEDLGFFLREKPPEISYTLMGVGSNLLVRDGGVGGVVIRLSKLNAFQLQANHQLDVGAGTLDATLTQLCLTHSIGGLEFLCGIPGSIGGALRMNAGAYGREIQDCLVTAYVMDPQGDIHHLTPQELGYTYRRCNLPKDWIFIGGRFQGTPAAPESIAATIQQFLSQREASQPIKARTGGSTFTNPPNLKAWELIDQAGCRGLRVGGAEMSHKHCNFMINTGTATAHDLESLGTQVQQRVLETTGVTLHWEIERIGFYSESILN